MIEKIKKYLLRHKEINFFKKNDSGSEYYRVGNSIIRVSDHIPISDNQPDTLNIVVSENSFVVMFGNRIINVNDYNDFKTFLKYHIKMCDCFKELINKGLGRASNDYIAREEKKIVKKQNKVARSLSATATIVETASVTYRGEKIDMPGYSVKKCHGVQSMINHNCFKTKEALLRHISQLNKN